MPEIVATTSTAGASIIPWVVVILLAAICVYLVFRISKITKPRASLEDYEAVKRLNIDEGKRFQGRWVLVFCLGIDGHIVNTERMERFEGWLFSESGRKMFEVKPGSIWNFGGVPAVFCWDDRYRTIDPVIDEAVLKNVNRINDNRKRTLEEFKEAVKNNMQDTPDEYPIDGWKALNAEFEKEHPDIQPACVGQPWCEISFDDMRAVTPATQPSLVFNIIERLTNKPIKKNSLGILDWIKKNPLVFGLIVFGIIAAVVFLPGMMK